MIARCRVLALVLTCIGMTHICQAADQPVDYARQIKPILRARCFSCHGAIKQKGGLRLDTVASMLKGGDSGAAITRKNISKSVLLDRVTATDAADRMPPEDAGEPLTAAHVALIRAWITAGATAPKDEQADADPKDHWAYRPIIRPAVPTVRNSKWVRNPIDAFLAQQHQQQDLAPQPDAPRIILLRRLHLDLIGIPPTNEEITAFEKDQTPGWYERTVKRLLNDPRHGERWARHWMDVWRYSDWWGLGQQLRNSQKHIWHWRDWIVESLNDDTPYDEMVRLMLAADELHPNDLDKLRATGFLARNYFLFNRNQWMEETVEHVSKGFLGLTMNCAKCHDHKYDPIEQVDFYKMRAFFEPYHVRMDVTPGEADLTKDGIPRAFDGRLETPTYRFVRGEEKQADKSTVIAPGVPNFLAFKTLTIAPVTLPMEAWQPGLRPWVIKAHLATADKSIQTTQAAVVSAQSKLTAAKKRHAELVADAKIKSAKPKPKPQPKNIVGTKVFHENFATLDETRWKSFGGKWSHKPGRLEQQQDGATRATLRWLQTPPRDFEATVRFTILGGSKWRSVSLVFDATQKDPANMFAASDSEQSVYVSAYAPGPKVQAAFHQGGKWQYPAEARVARPIKLNREYTLKVRVRGTLINASLDGQPAIAWRTPLARRDGMMQLTTFDALTVFHEVTIAPLPPNVSLRKAGIAPSVAANKPTSPKAALAAIAISQAELIVAEANAAVAKAERLRIERVAEAMRATKSLAENQSPENKTSLTTTKQERTTEAIRASRLTVAAKARQSVATAELALLRAAEGKKNSATKTVKTARTALQKANTHVNAEVKPTETFTPLVGAKWTPTRFASSGKDDPAVTFSPQSSGRRTALANWITDRRNPLTARVAANQIWMRHMGESLVPNVFDFGLKESQPTHCKLLDWLAAELMEHDWSMRHLHHVIVTSAAYRMSSSVAGGQANVAKDPDNRFLWRRGPIRLESQVVRDSILALAGTLDSKRGGPPVLRAQQAASKRRSLYFFHSNNDRNLFLTTFDESSVKECYRRDQSIVPQQALALTNSKLVLDASQAIAKRLSQGGVDDNAFIQKVFRVLVGIHASDAEITVSNKAIKAWMKLPNGSAESARAHFVWALVNHNDFVTLR